MVAVSNLHRVQVVLQHPGEEGVGAARFKAGDDRVEHGVIQLVSGPIGILDAHGPSPIPSNARAQPRLEAGA